MAPRRMETIAFKLFLCAYFSFQIFLLAQGKLVRHTFEVKYLGGNPDGVWTNNILAINDQFPGPLIEADAGDILEITVVNRIQDEQNVTLHWHGIHQRWTPFEDGPSQVTQCPIKYGSFQVYTFPVPLAGTYWYHSHVNSQYTEGLWGPIVIRDVDDPWGSFYDQEIIVTLSDWYHTSAHENEEWLFQPQSQNAPPYPFSVLMNGVGRYPCNLARMQERACEPHSQNRPVFQLQREKVHRLRLINASGWVTFNFTVNGHLLQPIEVDGVTVREAEEVEAVSIGSGQRYSFLLRTMSPENVQEGEEFMIRANLRSEFLFTRPQNINPYPEAVIKEATGVIRYTTSSSEDDSQVVNPVMEAFDYTMKYQSKPWSSLRFLDEMSLLPYDEEPVPTTVDKVVVLNITFLDDEDGIRRGSFNRRPFQLTSGVPELAKMILGVEIPSQTYPVILGYGDIVELVLNNPDLGSHPIHLHGHHFWVLGMGKTNDGPYDPQKHELRLTGFRRDTVMIKERSWLVIRFKADNVGVWTLHCHVDWHNLSGMAMTFVAAPELAHLIPIPQETKRVCAEHNVFI